MLPKFIALEGPDLSGKSAVATKLLHELCYRTSLGVKDVHLLQNPGGTPLGNQIRRIVKDGSYALDPLTLFYLFAANHADLAHTIKRRLCLQTTIIADRWWPSTYAYQGLAGIAPEHIVDVIRQLDSIVTPDKIIYLRCSNETAHKRMATRTNDVKNDRFEEGGMEKRTKLMNIYDGLADRGYMHRIDTDSLTLHEVTDRIIRIVYG